MAKKGEYKYAQLNNREWLYQKYWTENLNTYEIAELIGCHPSTVLRALKYKHIRIRTFSEAHKGGKYWLGKHRSEETKRKISETKKSKPLSKAVREKIGERLKGNKYALGKYRSEETKRKMSEAHTKLSLVQRKLNRAVSERVRWALRGRKAGEHWEKILGYELSDLMQTIEKEFRDGMCWENYGAIWHIDHIIPLARFHYNSPEDAEFKKAWALGNLQPLLIAENLQKHTNFRFY